MLFLRGGSGGAGRRDTYLLTYLLIYLLAYLLCLLTCGGVSSWFFVGGKGGVGWGGWLVTYLLIRTCLPSFIWGGGGLVTYLLPCLRTYLLTDLLACGPKGGGCCCFVFGGAVGWEGVGLSYLLSYLLAFLLSYLHTDLGGGGGGGGED